MTEQESSFEETAPASVAPAPLAQLPVAELAASATGLRIVYHPAPFPDQRGQLQTPPTVDLGDDIDTALEWMRRRLSVRSGPPLYRFENSPIEIAADAAAVVPDVEQVAAAGSDSDEAIEAWDAEQEDPLAALDDFEEQLVSGSEQLVNGEEALDTSDQDDPLAGLEELGAGGRRT